MKNSKKTIAISMLRIARKMYLEHKTSNTIYPYKEELIAFWGDECIRCRKILEAVK